MPWAWAVVLIYLDGRCLWVPCAGQTGCPQIVLMVVIRTSTNMAGFLAATREVAEEARRDEGKRVLVGCVLGIGCSHMGDGREHAGIY